MAASIFEAAGGAPAMFLLAEAWHRRCLADPVVRHAFSHGPHPLHVERLAAYWGEALGGPADYTATVATHESVLRMHAGNGAHQEMDERAVECFLAALDDAGVPEHETLRRALGDWFRWATAGMAAYPDSPDQVPAGLPMPRWTWAGPSADDVPADRAPAAPSAARETMPNRNLSDH